MKQILLLTVLIFLSLCYACGDKNNEPVFENNVTISSEIFGTNIYYVNGYSFEEGKFVPSLNSGSDVPDVLPQNILEVSGDVTGMALSPGPDNSFGFYKNFESENITEAENFYNNYSEVNVGAFNSLSDTLVPGQVYTFRSYKENYVKILIEEVRLNAGGASSGYVEADIRYNIQRDGSAVFDE